MDIETIHKFIEDFCLFDKTDYIKIIRYIETENKYTGYYTLLRNFLKKYPMHRLHNIKYYDQNYSFLYENLPNESKEHLYVLFDVKFHKIILDLHTDYFKNCNKYQNNIGEDEDDILYQYRDQFKLLQKILYRFNTSYIRKKIAAKKITKEFIVFLDYLAITNLKDTIITMMHYHCNHYNYNLLKDINLSNYTQICTYYMKNRNDLYWCDRYIKEESIEDKNIKEEDTIKEIFMNNPRVDFTDGEYNYRPKNRRHMFGGVCCDLDTNYYCWLNSAFNLMESGVFDRNELDIFSKVIFDQLKIHQSNTILK